jgi:hypothetical protein
MEMVLSLATYVRRAGWLLSRSDYDAWSRCPPNRLTLAE